MIRITQALSIFASILLLTGCSKKPTARFQTLADGLTVTCEFIGDGEITSFDWDFGDGNTSTTMHPTHTYSQAGTYVITLVVTGGDGSDESSQTITVEGSGSTQFGRSENPELHFADADGVMYAINVRSYALADDEIESTTERMASAWFKKDGKKVSVGDVEWHQGSASQQLDYDLDLNHYSWAEGTESGNTFKNSGVSWTIEGGNGFPKVGGTGLSNLYPFPSNKAVTASESEISTQAAYTLEVSGNMNNADSVFFSIQGTSGTVIKRMDGTTTSVTFSAAEVQSAGTGLAVIQVAAANYYSDSSTGKMMYTINQSVVNHTVTIK